MKTPKNYVDISPSNEEKFDSFIYKSFIPLCFFWLFQYLFLNEPTIGGDYKYTVYILGMPLVIGIVSLIGFRRKLLLLEIDTKDNFFLKLKSIGTIFAYTVIFSYVIFCTLPHVIWNAYNKHVADSNQAETIVCQVNEFQDGESGYKIFFYYRGKTESVRASYNSIKEYLNESPNKYKITLLAKRGIWGHYIIDNWKINKRYKKQEEIGNKN